MDSKEFRRITGKTKGAVHTFESKEDFGAFREAEEFCRERGFSVGSMQRDEPIGIARGDFYIAKWYNLSAQDKTRLDGVIVGEKRNGPVVVIFAK